MAEATYTRSDDKFQLLAGATLDAGQVIQLPTGEAAFLDAGSPVSSGAYSDALRTRGKVTIEAATGWAGCAGQEVYWDHSANKLTFLPVNDRDFLVGVLVRDKASADITAEVDLNKRCAAKLDATHAAAMSTTVGTHAAGGFGFARGVGGAVKLLLSATSEAQKVDLLTVDGMAPGAKWVCEAWVRILNDGAGSAPDFNIGVANGTNATDADSITQAAFFHLDGNSLDIRAASRDGTTTVAITDTTVDYTEGSAVANRVHLLIDGRDLTSVKLYVNGVRVLSATTFRLDAATGPLFLLAHLVKTSAADVYEVDIDRLVAWTSEQ